MKIISFEAENTRVLKRVRIDPEGNIVILGGDNGAGKSTVLQDIALTLGGGEQPMRPIREGQNAGRCKLKLGKVFGGDPDYTVTQVWDARGVHLEVRNAEGKAVKESPRALLRKLFNAVAFNPLGFADEKDPRKQAEILKKLVGLDFAELDAQRANLYTDREDSGRDLRAAEGQLAGMVDVPTETPDEELSIASLLAAKTEAEQKNRANKKVREAAESAFDDCAKAKAALDEARERFERATREHKAAVAKMEESVAAAKELVDEDVSTIDAKLANAEGTNRAVRAKKARAAKTAEVERMRKERQALTDKIAAIDEQKAAALAAAKWPVPGLGFDADGVTYKGLPFAQASKAERYRVSVAIGAAISGDLRVMLIEDASLYDKKSMALLSQIAQENDMSMWIERVGDGDKGAIILQDGEIVAKGEDEQPLNPERRVKVIHEGKEVA